MQLMRITIDLAFHDTEGASLDDIRGELVHHAIVALNAEVATTRTASEAKIEIADPDFNGEKDPFHDWQVSAREHLETAFQKDSEPEGARA
jgi:hypothetical protein